jgi:hypothetical protein
MVRTGRRRWCHSRQSRPFKVGKCSLRPTTIARQYFPSRSTEKFATLTYYTKNSRTNKLPEDLRALVSTTTSQKWNRLAHPPRQPVKLSCSPRAPTHAPHESLTRPCRNRKKPEENPKIPLDTASYKLYYVNYEMRLPRSWRGTLRFSPKFPAPLLLHRYFLISAGFPAFCCASS